MKRRAPFEVVGQLGAALPACGRASRFAVAGGELWRLGAEDEPIAERLLALGASSIGAFVEGGADADGVWLLRRLDGEPLATAVHARKGPWEWREAARVVVAIARALAASEQMALFPGPLAPDGVLVSARAVHVRAEPLVVALVGGDASLARSGETVAPLWTPPEQANGAVWDSAANRYALGLVAYRLLAGAHPFTGAGIRHALAEAARREAPPLPDELAAALPPGLQSLVLRMLHPSPKRRPRDAKSIAAELTVFLEAPRAPPALAHPERLRYVPRRDPVHRAETAPPAPAPARSASKPQRSAGLWPIAAGVVVALGTMLLAFESSPPPDARTSAPHVSAAQPLTEQETDAASCAHCHTREAAEWRRSVMAHAVKSPLFNALESLVEEQVGRDDTCPGGAGILRRTDVATACRDRKSGLAVTGSGGEHWCVNCHSPAENLGASMPAWDGRAGGDARSRRPVKDLLAERALEGISCGFCHQVHGPVGARGSRGYQGNPTWTSFTTGSVFSARPEDARGLLGIANSGYDLRPEELLPRLARLTSSRDSAAIVHVRPTQAAESYLRSSEFCGSCHDVRLFGTDALGAARGEHFKRLRNAYSEWSDWAQREARAGRSAASCQDCHMSTYPGVCEPVEGGGRAAIDPGCPAGTRFSARRPGSYPKDGTEPDRGNGVVHYFSGVDVPLTREFDAELIDEAGLDLHGVPLGARRRRDLILRHTFRFALANARRGSSGIEIPIEIENTGAGHRVPAGFSQEREIWVHLVVRDETGRSIYEVGRVDRNDEDLRDKIFDRVTTSPDRLDSAGRPEGLFGADIRDGPDVPQWAPPQQLGGAEFRGRGLLNLQNGFLRCVRCIGTVAPDGHCEPSATQREHRADRFTDGIYDADTGECRSNLSGLNALFETYFPVGALDASRGLAKAPDAIIDTRSAPPNVRLRYIYDLPTGGSRGPFRVEARLLFRAFPPYLIRAFASYEREQARRGLRPSGPLVSDDMLKRIEVVELAHATAEIR